MCLFDLSIGSGNSVNLMDASVSIFPLINFDFVLVFVDPAVSFMSKSNAVNPPMQLMHNSILVSVFFSNMLFPSAGPYPCLLVLSIHTLLLCFIGIDLNFVGIELRADGNFWCVIKALRGTNGCYFRDVATEEDRLCGWIELRWLDGRISTW